MSGAKNIGVALDFSENSMKALNWAIDNLLTNGDSLIVIHVMPDELVEKSKLISYLEYGHPPLPLSDFIKPEVMKNYDLECDKEVLDMLDIVSRQKEVIILAKLYYGDARLKLCQAVEDLHLDTVVLGRRGIGRPGLPGQLEGMLLGSVSQFVLTNTSCSVVVIKK